jgi:molybdate transport system regulatory protein
MSRKQLKTMPFSIRPRLRIMRGDDIALGPGRADLLELIATTGSLRSAAKQMGISYMRAWQLVKFTNQCFREPVVAAVRGGKTGGGAKLTSAGAKALGLYRRMEKESQRAAKLPWLDLKRLLKPTRTG